VRIFEHVKLEYNPLLKHWVDAIIRCQPVLEAADGEQGPPYGYPDWWLGAQRARMEIIKDALRLTVGMEIFPPVLFPSFHGLTAEKDHNEIEYTSPNNLIEDMAKTRYEPIPVEWFIEILESQGMSPCLEPNPLFVQSPTTLETTAESSPCTASPPTPLEKGMGSSPGEEEKSIMSTAANSDPIDDFNRWLQTSPHDAVYEITRRPCTIPNLDFLTLVLSSTTTANLLAKEHLHPIDVARQHLQRTLMRFERATEVDDEAGGEEMLREAMLLTVYLKNALARGVLKLESVDLDIEELCMRYIWIPAVRDFRLWLTDAIEAASAPGPGPGPGPAVGGAGRGG
jgi:hypothetical protein